MKINNKQSKKLALRIKKKRLEKRRDAKSNKIKVFIINSNTGKRLGKR